MEKTEKISQTFISFIKKKTNIYLSLQVKDMGNQQLQNLYITLSFKQKRTFKNECLARKKLYYS